MFGPTTGDRVRLGDTALWIEVEKDFVSNPPLFTAKGLLLSRLSMETKSNLEEVRTFLHLILPFSNSFQVKAFERAWVKPQTDLHPRPLI